MKTETLSFDQKLKNEIENYLNLEKQASEFIDLSNSFIGVCEENFNKYNNATKEINDKMFRLVDAFCTSTGTSKDYFLLRLNEFTEWKGLRLAH